MILNYLEEQLKNLGAIFTATEIAQQPNVWNKVIRNLAEMEQDIEKFLAKLNNQYEKVRVILTGAGTSAYVGNTALPYSLKNNQFTHFSFESIATTDLVASPHLFFQKETPTLLVSFARSGNSPESIAAVQLAEQFVDSLYHLIITCNSEGQLAQITNGNEHSFMLLMPKETNDQGFAMTSSFTSMLLSVSFVFQINKIKDIMTTVNMIASKGNGLLNDIQNTAIDVCGSDFNRIVYLGSGVFTGLARESALKMLELTSGQTVALFESTLGFRHGPKSVLTEQTVVVVYVSDHSYTRNYDIDMLKEIYNEGLNVKVIAIAQNPCDEIINNCHFVLKVPLEGLVEDIFLTFLYISFAQTIALTKSISLGILPDNPSPSGMVNRVVKGVTIYPY